MSNQLETVLLKKTPCNGCRERKRKCSYEQPCERCVKFNIECTYTVMPSPKDIEYIQELEQMKQIELIQNQITSMEQELSILKLAQDNIKLLSSPPITPPSTANYTEVEHHDYPSPVSMNSAQQDDNMYNRENNTDLHQPLQHFLPCKFQDDDCFGFYPIKKKSHRKHQRIIAKSNSIEAIVTTNDKDTTKPWTLTVKNGTMSIETHISCHAELMTHLNSMLSTSIKYQEKGCQLPFSLSEESWTPKNAMGTVLGILVWRKYGKSRFKSMTKYSPSLLHQEPAQQLIQVSPQNIESITMRLVYTYFQCLHSKMIYLHVPTFIRLFMKDEQHIMQSPVVMALCSLVCHQTCKHVREVVPNESLSDYGLFYLEQAKELISEKFDEASLETLLTYSFMAVHHVKTNNDKEGNKYLCIAERIYNILLPQYQFQDGKPTSDESILFSRFYRSIYHLRCIIQLHDLMDCVFKVKNRGGYGYLYKLIDHHNELDICPSVQDTPKETEFIQMRQYLQKLRGVIKEGARCAASDDFPTFISTFGHHVEMAMRHWYRHVLPPNFQLTLPLFEDNIPDIEFFTKLELECIHSPIPILTTLDLYNEYLIMAKSYIPKAPSDGYLDNEKLLHIFKNTHHNIPMSKEQAEKIKDKRHHWMKVITRMRYLKQMEHPSFTEEELAETDEEYFTRFIMALNPTKINFEMPLIHPSVRTAFNMVRIIQFLITRDYSCYLDLRWVLNAWDVLLRAAKFKYQQPGDKEITLDRVRANLILCLNIIRDQTKFSRRDTSGTLIEDLEREFSKLF